MDKLVENGNDMSGDNKRSQQNPHLSDDQLLLALDGESSAQEAARVEGHLEACWSCRARREQIEKAIGDVVEYRDQLLKPHFPMPAGGRSMFVARLQQVALSAGKPSLWARILRGPRALAAIQRDLIPRYAWITAFLGVSVALLSFARLWHSPKVSANELLENAQSSEVRALQSVAKPVLYQKLRIRVDSQVVTRTIYRDPIGRRQADRMDTVEPTQKVLAHSSASEAELRQSFLNANLNWQDPLSPATYSAWHKSLAEKVDEVTTSSNDLIILKTKTPEGPIAEARITVRATDFHPIEEDLLLQDSRQVEVRELAWEVLPIEAINVGIFESETEPTAEHLTNLAPQPAGVTDAELAEAELQARLAIHDEKADLGEQIELDRAAPKLGPRSVVVQGIISTQERMSDLVAALRGIPHVELRLQTVEEAQLQQSQEAVIDSNGSTTQLGTQTSPGASRLDDGIEDTTRSDASADASASGPALERQLEKLFPIRGDRAAFVNETVELLQASMAQAWALRRLSDRYSREMTAELSNESKETLELMIRDHVSLIRQNLETVRTKVSPLISVTAVPSGPSSPTPETALPETVTSDWRTVVGTVFSATQREHDSGTALLAGPNQPPSQAQASMYELQQALSDLETQMQVLYEEVSGPFLRDPKNAPR